MSRTRKPVAVLGCGPAGLLAAHAAAMRGHEVQIYSVVKASPIGGAQFLHRAIPALTDTRPDAMIIHRVVGDSYTYQRKAYGVGAQPDFVSFSHVADGLSQPAWNMRAAYTKLWEHWGPHMEDTRLTYSWIEDNRKDFSLVVVAVPKPAVCINHDAKHVMHEGARFHVFQDQRIQILNRCLPGGPGGPNHIIYYDGSADTSWYRASNIFGTGSTEWGSNIKLPFPEHEVVSVTKPVMTTCDCWAKDKGVMNVGRFGKWKKGELTHHAFEQVAERLA